jgi:hypothetical protein
MSPARRIEDFVLRETRTAALMEFEVKRFPEMDFPPAPINAMASGGCRISMPAPFLLIFVLVDIGGLNEMKRAALLDGWNDRKMALVGLN